MAIMAMDPPQKHKLLYLLTLLAITSFASKAGDLKFTPTLTADETYTDNVNLTKTNEVSSLVSQFGVDIRTSYQAKNASFELSSTSSYALYSHDHEIDNDFHTLNSQARFMLWPNGIAFTASASIGNQSRNSATQGLADIVSGNTVQVENYLAGLSYNITNSDYILSSSTNYNISQSEDNLGERKGYSTNINAKNGTSATLVFWDINANYLDNSNLGQSFRTYRGEAKLGIITGYKFQPFLRYYDEDNTGTVSTEQNTALNSYGIGIRWLLYPRLIMDITYNKPIGNTLNSQGDLQEKYISANIDWQPSSRTKLSISHSQRFFGDSYALELSHKNRRLTNIISYQESVQAFTRDNFSPVSLGSFWCPFTENPDPNSCFINDGRNINFDDYQLVNLTDIELIEDDQYSLNKVLQWTSTLALARTTFSLSLNGQNRENLTTHIKTKNKNATLSVSRRISGNSTLNFTGSFRESDFSLLQESGRLDRYRQYKVAYSRELNQRLTAELSISAVNRSSTTNQFDYQESRLTFEVNKEF